MYEASWNGLYDVRWEEAPLGAEAIRLVEWLRVRGYAERTRRDYGHSVVHLGQVLHAKGESAAGKDLDEAVVADFADRHLPACRCYQRRQGRRLEHVRDGLRHLLAMLREEGVIPAVPVDHPPYEDLLERHTRFLRQHRGLAESTIAIYRGYVREFLATRGDAVSPSALVRLTAADLCAFAEQRSPVLGRGTCRGNLASSLSGFYRWLSLCGHGGSHLVGVIPRRRRYRLAEVPCAISWDEVRRLLAAVDVCEPNGRRNYAMLLLSATYGLRGCEVRALRISDIDWTHDEFTVNSSKTGRSRKLPLTREVGAAILDYLREDRGSSIHREVFLSSRPPCGRLHGNINGWLARCFDRAQIDAAHRGGHVLRHSLAVQLLRRGESLKSIGDVLGHRQPDTTRVYTKLHIEDLRSVALEPEVVS